MDSLSPRDFLQQELAFNSPLEKRCTGPCGRWLPATPEYFQKHPMGKYGVTSCCRECFRNRPMKEYSPCEEKQCTGPCGRMLPATTEYFHRNGKNGLYPMCKECKSEKKKESYCKPEVHKRALASARAYRESPEGQEYRQTYYEEWSQRPETKEYKRNYNKAYKPIYFSQPGKKEHAQAVEKERCSSPEWKAHRLDYEREYLQIPEKRERRQVRDRVNHHNRRARINAIPGTYTPEEVQEQLKRQRHRCYYAACGYSKFPRVKENGKWKYIFDVEHTFPVSRVAGSDIPANSMSYLVLACESCNSSKGNKYPHEWFEGGRLL